MIILPLRHANLLDLEWSKLPTLFLYRSQEQHKIFSEIWNNQFFLLNIYLLMYWLYFFVNFLHSPWYALGRMDSQSKMEHLLTYFQLHWRGVQPSLPIHLKILFIAKENKTQKFMSKYSPPPKQKKKTQINKTKPSHMW